MEQGGNQPGVLGSDRLPFHLFRACRADVLQWCTIPAIGALRPLPNPRLVWSKTVFLKAGSLPLFPCGCLDSLGFAAGKSTDLRKSGSKSNHLHPDEITPWKRNRSAGVHEVPERGQRGLAPMSGRRFCMRLCITSAESACPQQPPANTVAYLEYNGVVEL